MAANISHHIAAGTAAAQTYTTASFTPQDDSVIFVFGAGYNSNNTTAASWTISDSQSLTWTEITTLAGNQTEGGGFYDLDWTAWYAVVTGTASSMTITIDKLPDTNTSNYGIHVVSVTGLESPYYTNEVDNQDRSGSVTVTRTAPTGPTIAAWFAGGDGVTTNWSTPDSGYTVLGTSGGTIEVASRSWESATSTATSIDETWTSSGTEYNTVGYSVELVEAAATGALVAHRQRPATTMLITR